MIDVIELQPVATLDVTLRADSRVLSRLRHECRLWLDTLGIAPRRRDEIVVVVSELAANAARHAYRGDRRPASRPTMRITLAVIASGISIRVADHGHWRTRNSEHDGRGLPMVLALVENVQYETGADGTVVTAVAAV